MSSRRMKNLFFYLFFCCLLFLIFHSNIFKECTRNNKRMFCDLTNWQALLHKTHSNGFVCVLQRKKSLKNSFSSSYSTIKQDVFFYCKMNCSGSSLIKNCKFTSMMEKCWIMIMMCNNDGLRISPDEAVRNLNSPPSSITLPFLCSYEYKIIN